MSNYLEKIILTQFKNYSKEELAFSKQLNCFVGNNGMGKTNLLDAIYYLCMTKSHFSGSDSYAIQKGADFLRLEGIFRKDSPEEEEEIINIVAKVIPKKKKSIEKNAKPYEKLADHIGLLPVVVIAPGDTELVQEGSEERRRFIDNTLSQLDPVYLKHLIQYNKVLRQRNAYLKNAIIERRFDKTLVQTFDEQLLPLAQVIFKKRAAFAKTLTPLLEQIYHEISGGAESISCTYASPLLQDDFENILKNNQEKDRILGRTTAGPHRDDLKFFINQTALKRFASQGQMKSFTIALKLAQFQLLKNGKSIAPILLLDDIFDKLDASRVKQLLSLLLDQHFGQVFLTDTDQNRVENIAEDLKMDYRRFLIQNGQATIL